MQLLNAKSLMRTTLSAAISSALVMGVSAETLDTRIGKLEFTHSFSDGYPTDATVDRLEHGWEWGEIQPESGTMPYTTHQMDPSFLLRIFESIYHRSPRTWLASIQGEDFGFGEGLSPEAETRAEKAISEIVKHIAINQA